MIGHIWCNVNIGIFSLRVQCRFLRAILMLMPECSLNHALGIYCNCVFCKISPNVLFGKSIFFLNLKHISLWVLNTSTQDENMTKNFIFELKSSQQNYDVIMILFLSKMHIGKYISTGMNYNIHCNIIELYFRTSLLSEVFLYAETIGI